MSGTESTPAVEGQSTAQQTPPVETPKPQVLADSLPSDALKARIDAAKATGRAEFLRELGVTDPEQLKAALAMAAAAEDAKRSDAEKLAIHLSELDKTRASLAEAKSAIGLLWAEQSAALTPEQLEAVNALAGDDPTAKVKTLGVLRKTWATQAAQQSAAAQTPAAAPPTAPAQTPATTSPSGGAPPPTTTSQTDHKAVYEQLSKTNPVKAARYLNAHEREIFPA